MTNLVAGIIGMFLGFLLALLVAYVHHRLESLTCKLREAERKLEDIQERKRQTGPTLAGLEDAISLARNLQDNRNIESVLIEALANTLCTLRQGPYAYDPNKQSIQREDFK